MKPVGEYPAVSRFAGVYISIKSAEFLSQLTYDVVIFTMNSCRRFAPGTVPLIPADVHGEHIEQN
ncbi:hypothetical protein SDC9_165303 [bioreactor metagenome]|uniref:Uncharacterized protein n=1 Tax=bioreactor metagenome TaxID=1076179 RepID=A0A645FU05_9ZZZZ